MFCLYFIVSILGHSFMSPSIHTVVVYFFRQKERARNLVVANNLVTAYSYESCQVILPLYMDTVLSSNEYINQREYCSSLSLIDT